MSKSELLKWAKDEHTIDSALWLLERAREKYTTIKDISEERNDQASLEYMHGAQDLLKHLEQLCGKGGES